MSTASSSYRTLGAAAAPPASPTWLSRACLYAVSPLGIGDTYRGLADELDRLDRLGITGLILEDVFRPDGGGVPSPAFGSEDEFRGLVIDAHERGVRILPVWPEDPIGESPSRRARRDNAEALVRDFGVDGFWVAEAGTTPTDVWMGIRRVIRRVAPDSVLLAATDSSWLREGPFDGTLDAGWSRAWDDAFRGRARGDRFRLHLDRENRVHGESSGRMRAVSGAWCRGRELDVDFIRLALCTQLLTAGIPVIRAGQEVGVKPGSTPIAVADGDPHLPPILSRLGNLRRTHVALRTGETLAVKTDRSPHALAFVRRSTGEEFMVLSNLTRRPLHVGVRGPAWRGRTGLDLDTLEPVIVGERHPLVIQSLSVKLIELGAA